MTHDNMKALVQRVTEEVYNKGNLALIDELFTPDFKYHDPLTPEGGADIEAFKQFVGFMRSAFPDIQITTDEMIAEGDVVAQRWHWRATHRGELLGVPATNKQMTDHGISWGRIKDGKLVELRISPDSLGVLRQLGVAPELELAGGQPAST